MVGIYKLIAVYGDLPPGQSPKGLIKVLARLVEMHLWFTLEGLVCSPKTSSTWKGQVTIAHRELKQDRIFLGIGCGIMKRIYSEHDAIEKPLQAHGTGGAHPDHRDNL